MRRQRLFLVLSESRVLGKLLLLLVLLLDCTVPVVGCAEGEGDASFPWGMYLLPWHEPHRFEFPSDDTKTEKGHDPASRPDIAAPRPFKVRVGNGSGWHGFESLAIDDQGRCRFVFMRRHDTDDPTDVANAGRAKRRRTIWHDFHKAEFNVDLAVIERLRELILDGDMLSLDSVYSSDVQDGAQCFLWISDGVKSRGFWFDNNFPSSFRELAEFCSKEIIAANAATFERAVPATADEVREDYEAILTPEELARSRELEEKARIADQERMAEEKAVREAKAADTLLRFAKKFLDANDETKARKWLERVIERYPNSPAAVEATSLLLAIQQESAP